MSFSGSSSAKAENRQINAVNPYAVFFTGDINGHSRIWWPEGDMNTEGKEIDETFTDLNLTQIISEPAN